MTEPITLPTERVDAFDPPPPLGRLRAERPIAPMAYPDGHVGWLVTSHDAARRILADPRFTHRPELRHAPLRDNPVAEPGKPAGPGWFPMMDPPEHTRYRRMLTSQFTVRRMKLLEPRIERIVADRLDAMAAAGPPAELVSAFALPVPSLVICELLGVPYADHAMFQEHTATVTAMASRPEDAMAAMKALGGYLAGLVRRKRADPGDDVLGGLIAEGELTDEELTNIALLLLVAGHETTANMIGLGVFALLRGPGQLAALRAAPELAVEELLRYLTIIQFGVFRAALEDVELDGTVIREGQTVTLALPAANRDPVAFPDPDSLRLDRENARRHLAFGHGVHQCLGQQLARIEMRIAYTALFERFGGLALAVPAERVPMRDAFTYGVGELPVTWG